MSLHTGASAPLPSSFLSVLPRSHFIPFFRVPAIVPSFLLYGIKYQAARHNVPLSFWVPFISLSSSLSLPPSSSSSTPTHFLRNLRRTRYRSRERKIDFRHHRMFRKGRGGTRCRSNAVPKSRQVNQKVSRAMLFVLAKYL